MFLLALPAAVQAQFTHTTNNGTLTITGYDGASGSVSIPAAINGLPVTSIGNKAFGSCTNLTDAMADLIALLQSDVMRNIEETARQNLAKYLMIVKVRLENAIGLVRRGPDK